MGQNHSSPNSPRHHPDYYPRHAHRDHHSVLDYPKRNDAPKSSSFVNNVPPSTKICSCRGKGLSCHNVLSSFNEENEVRVSSTTNKSKGSSTIKSYNTSQEPRKSEDFDIGQMDENADLRKKRASFLENHGYLDSGLISNEILSKIGMKAEPLPYKDRISIMSSYQNHSPLGNKDSKLEISTIGPHFMERETHRLVEKEGDDDADIIMKTEVCEKEEEPYEIKYKDRMDSPLCMMESMEFKRERIIIKDRDDEVILHDSNASSPNRPARHYIGYPASNKVVDYTRGFRRPDLTASFEEDQLEPNLVKDLDMVSLHSDDVNVPEIKSPNGGYQGFSPKKMHKNNRILERRDGTYQEVEFSFKPNTLSKGSQRYTSEEENATAAKRESLDSIENPLSEQKDGLEIDINLAQHSPKFINSPLSSNQVRFGTASSKSSAVCNKNSPRISPHNRDIGLVQALNTGNTNIPSPKELFTDEVRIDLKPKEPLKPNHYIGDTDIGRIAKKHSRDLPFMPPSSRIMTPLNDSKNTQHISPINQNILPLNYLNTGNFYEKTHSRQISKENKPTLDMAVIQGVTKLDTKKPQTTRSNHKVVRSHIPDNILKDIHKRDIRRGSNPLNSPALRQNQLFPQFQSFSKESEGSYSATRILKEHNILKKISNQATNMSKDSKRSSASLKQNNIKNKNQRLKIGHANTFIEQPPESFHLDDSIARLERRKQSIINDLKSNKTVAPTDYYRVQIKDTYCVSPMVGGNHSFVYPVQSVRNSSKMQVEVECEVAAKDLIAGTPAGLDSRAPVQAKPRSTVRQHSKLCRNCRENQENRARSSREENATITNRYAYSHQVSPTRDDCQFEHTAEMLASKKVSLERKNVLKDPKKSSKDKNSKIQLYLNSTAELPERPFSRLTPNRMQGEIEPLFRADPITQLERKRKDNPRKTLMQNRF